MMPGYRYTWDTRETFLHNRQILGLPYDTVLPITVSPTGYNCTNANVLAASPAGRPAVAAACNQVQIANFAYPAFAVGLDWQATDDILVYVTTRGAAKAGGWNVAAGALPSFGPEKVKDVEGGLKATWLNNRLRTNVAVFHTWKTNQQAQVSAFVPGIGVTGYIHNDGDTRVWGPEFEVTAVPWKGMEINGNLSLMDGKYRSGSFSEVQRIASATPLAGCAAAPATAAGVRQFDCTVDLSGLPLTQLPKTQFNIGATQSIPAGNNEFVLHADYSYVGSQFFRTVLAASQQPQSVKDNYAAETALGKVLGYGLLSARVAYRLMSPEVEIYAFGQNLLDNKYLTRRFSDLYATGGLGIAVDYAGAPRIWGIGVDWRFGQ